MGECNCGHRVGQHGGGWGVCLSEGCECLRFWNDECEAAFNDGEWS